MKRLIQTHPQNKANMTVMTRSTTFVAACVWLIVIANDVLALSDSLQTCHGLAAAPKQEKYKAMLSAAKAIENDIIDIRRTLHRRPAIMYEEYEAQALVIETLTELGLGYVSYRIPVSIDQRLLLMYMTICALS